MALVLLIIFIWGCSWIFNVGRLLLGILLKYLLTSDALDFRFDWGELIHIWQLWKLNPQRWSNSLWGVHYRIDITGVHFCSNVHLVRIDAGSKPRGKRWTFWSLPWLVSSWGVFRSYLARLNNCFECWHINHSWLWYSFCFEGFNSGYNAFLNANRRLSKRCRRIKLFKRSICVFNLPCSCSTLFTLAWALMWASTWEQYFHVDPIALRSFWSGKIWTNILADEQASSLHV